jgi:NAD(P)-dependent dehydrogenase (short-subunit alcohol dehydrogenase family)
MREAMVLGAPLGRLGTVDDIGQMAAFLASPLASYVTGTVTVVDGGYYLGGSSRFAETLRAEAGAGAVA